MLRIAQALKPLSPLLPCSRTEVLWTLLTSLPLLLLQGAKVGVQRVPPACSWAQLRPSEQETVVVERLG